MAKSKHYGAFAGGFAKSFAEMMKLYLMQQHYEALNKHYAAQEELWANRGLGRGKGLTPEERAAGAAAGADWARGGGDGGAVTGKFWTPENQKHAYDYLMSTGKFSEYGAAGAVARMTREAPDGPTSVNPSSKAFGIAQWLGDRKAPIAGNTNFDDQLKYYAGADLDAPAQARAKEQFKNASSPEEGSYAAMHFERAGGYQESGGRSDVLLNSTPTASVYNTVHGEGKEKPTETASATTPTKGPNKGKAPKAPATTTPAATPEAKPTEAKGGDQTAAAATPYQVAGDAGGVTEAGAERAARTLEEHRAPPDMRTAAEMDRDSPAPPPGGTPPRNERALPPSEQAPPPGSGGRIGAIPPGDTVPAQEAGFRVPPEAGFPESAVVRPDVNAPGPEDPEIAARQAHGQGSLPPRPLTLLSPSDRPSSGVEKSGIPPYDPLSSIRTPRIEYPPTTYPSSPSAPVPQPPLTASHMPPQQNVPGQTAVGTPTDADKPAPASQPVSATHPTTAIPSTPAQDPRFVQVSRPNADVVGRQSVPYTTAIDLSHLFGPNPPLSQRAPAPPSAPPTSSRPPDDWGGAVGAPDMSDMALGMQLNTAKGGPITQRVRLAKGGAIPSRPMMKFAAGGVSFAGIPGVSLGSTDALPSQGFSEAAYVNQNPNAPYKNLTMGPNTDISTYGTQLQANIDALTPEQRAYMNNQVALRSQANAFGSMGQPLYGGANPGSGGWGSVYQGQGFPYFGTKMNLLNEANQIAPPAWATPAPAPTPTPAAPAPTAVTPPSAQNIVTYPSSSDTTADPTSTTTTGTPGTPNTITAKTYDPNKIGTTGSGSTVDSSGNTNYNVGEKDDTTQILSRKGGPIPRVTRRVKYDDGGGVSPSFTGMPPGLGGGQQAIPPIYYNPATYAAAGAPVGRGVSATSAPTYLAGAIPSLPMARGGIVTRYDDGGEVSVGDMSPDMMEASQTAADDRMTTQLLDQRDAAANAPPTLANDGYYTPADFMSQGGEQGGAAPSPITPEISDGQGNPSRGLIAAISDGLHWLGDHLGLVGGAQAHPAIATDPQTQTNRANFVSGRHNVGDMDAATHADIANTIDPGNTLDAAERNIAVMEGTYRYMLQENSPNAGRMAASILQYSVQTSQRFAEEAAKQLYDGNLQGAVDNINHASDAIPDGRLTHVTLNKDGTAIVTATGMDGRVLWQQRGSAAAILQYATNRGRTGQMQWDALEEQAGKYNPEFADMAKNRRANAVAQTKADADAAAQDQANEAIGKLGPQFETPASTPSPTPEVTPRVTPAADTTTASTGVPASPGGGTTPAPTPTGADENQGQGPTKEAAITGALQPAISPTPSPADLPAPGSQDVDLMHNAAYQNIVATTAPKYFTSDGRPIVGNQVMMRPPTIDEVTLKSYAPQVKAAYDERWRQYNQAVQENTAAMRQDIDGQRRDLAADITSRRQADITAHSDIVRQQTQEHSDIAAETRAQNQRDFEKQKETDARTWTLTKPRDRNEVDRTFNVVPNETGVATGKEPVSYMAEALGLVKQDGTPDIQTFNSKLDRSQQAMMTNALTNGFAFSPGVNVATVADLVTGLVTNPNYIAHPTPIPPDEVYGVPRVSITVDRKNPKTGETETTGTFVLPVEDYRNLKAVYQQYVKAHPAPPENTTTTTTTGAPASPSRDFPAPTAPVTMTPRGPVAPPPAPFVRQPTPLRGPSGGTGASGPRRGFGGLPPQPQQQQVQ